MSDDIPVPRDRQIRTEALHAATRIGAGVVGGDESFRVDHWTHAFAHYIHSGVWFGANDSGDVDCPYGETCRFNRKAAE
jgi:hypothetical protein